MDGADDLYAVLGVSPHADDRAVKLAYVARIREHPPETHPEEFRRIRRAYEVLSDPESRARYDAGRVAQTPEDAEGDALWNAARAAHQAGDGGSARRLLERLVELRPGALGAWHALGTICLELGAPADAERAFRRVQEAQPGAWGIHLDLARALRAKGERRPARELAERALELAGEDLQARVAVADLLVELGQHGRAREVIEGVIAAEAAPFPIVPLVLRLARSDLVRGRHREAAGTVRAAAAGWSRAEAEGRRAAAGALAAFASDLYEAGRGHEGDEVLAACHQLAPETVPLPPQVALLLATELDPGDRAWLEDGVRTGNALFGQHRSPVGLPGWILVGLTLGLLGVLFGAALLGERHAGGPGGVASNAAFLFLLGVGAFGAARAAWRRWRGRIGEGVILDRAHLLRVRHDRVRVLPLLLLRAIEARVLSSRLVRLRFRFCGRYEEEALFSNREEADAFARQVAERRQELVQLLASGRAFDGPRVGAFPPASLLPGRSLLRRQGIVVDRLSVAAACTAAALALVVAWTGELRGARAEADEAWARARGPGRLADYLALAAKSGHPHAAEAARAAEDILRQARARWQEGAAVAPGSPLVERLLDPAGAEAPRVSVRLVRTLDRSGLEPDLPDPGPALQAVSDQDLSGALARALGAAVSLTTQREDAPAVTLAAHPAALSLVLRVDLVPASGVYRRGPSEARLAVLRADWELEARPPWGGGQVLARGSVEPAGELLVPASAWEGARSGAAAAGYAAQQRAALLAAIAGAVEATGARLEAAALEAAVGDLGSTRPPPDVVRRLRAGGKLGR